MSGDLFDPPAAPFAERLAATHTRVVGGEPSEVETRRRGRIPGSKVETGPDGRKRVVAPSEPSGPRPAEEGDDILNDRNFRRLLNPVCDVLEQTTGKKITPEDRDDGAALHASAFRNHAPDILKRYADIALCLGWWFALGFKIGVKPVEALRKGEEKSPGDVGTGRETAASEVKTASDEAARGNSGTPRNTWSWKK